MDKRDYDAVIVGSGPNGLAAAITLQAEGLSVIVIEAKETIGGGARSAELTLPGFIHDVCSAIHPLGASSPFFSRLPLEKHGLEYLYPALDAAHPFDDGSVAVLTRDIDKTATYLGADGPVYRRVMRPLVSDWPLIIADVLAPLHIPRHIGPMVRFGLPALSSARYFSKRFSTMQAKGLWAGMAAHAIEPLSNLASSAIALTLMLSAHNGGWPVAKGGSASIVNALASYFVSLGGKIQTGVYVRSMKQIPAARAVLFDVTPRQLLEIAGERFSSLYAGQLRRYRYGPGVFKIDWALDGQVPFKLLECRQAATIHLGNTFGDIAEYEAGIWKNKIGPRPFVLMAQQSIVDPSRAPSGKHTAWAYCHVPHGSEADMTDAIEKQVERHAPGFRDLILGRHTLNAASFEQYNFNYIGGDINGGVIDIGQLFTRPALRFSPYRTSARGLYICSSSTPPGGGVHGMCGFHAARRALKDVFGKNLSLV